MECCMVLAVCPRLEDAVVVASVEVVSLVAVVSGMGVCVGVGAVSVGGISSPASGQLTLQF